MKALSVRQPFAFLIGEGQKTIELRSKPTRYRGKILICASKGGDDWWVTDAGNFYKLPKGAHVCIANIIDCRPATQADAISACCAPEDIKHGMWAWVLADDATHVVPTPVVGRLNFFDVPDNKIDDGGDISVLSLYETGTPTKNASILE